MESLDADELEDSFVLDRNLDEADSTGRVSGDEMFTSLPEELGDQVRAFLKAARQQKRDAIPDKRKRDEIYVTAVHNAIIARLGQYPTSAEEDSALFENTEDRMRMAVEVRMGEKVLLHAARDLVAAKMAEADDVAMVDEPASKRSKK